jgi:tetrahydromethanopterin S-methyltransferase subunit F
MNQPLLKKFVPIIVTFILINVLVFIFQKTLIIAGFNVGFLLASNLVLFLLTCFGFFIQTKGVRSTNVHAFIRGVYSSLLLKMFIIVIAIVIYILVMGGQINKPALFTSMGIYLVYTSMEVIQLMKIARKKTDA